MLICARILKKIILDEIKKISNKLKMIKREIDDQQQKVNVTGSWQVVSLRTIQHSH